MWNSRTPISDGEQATLDHLKEFVDASEETQRLTRAAAVGHLVEQGIDRVDAWVHIEQLLLKGYLYEVEDELRFPLRS
jgi:hypothetical protein